MSRLKGFKHSIVTRQKISKGMKGNKQAFQKGHRGYWKDKNLSKRHKINIGIKECGSKHWNWKGGKHKTSRGYILIHNPSHPFCDSTGYIREHRLVMEKHLGRYLKSTEGVHHKNGNKQDNRIENLILFVSNKNWHPEACPKCGFKFLIK